MEVAQKVSIHCHTCKHATLHEAVAVKYYAWTEQVDGPFGLDYELEYDLLVCNTCRSPQLRWATRIDQTHDEGQWTERYIPPKPLRSIPDWVFQLSKELQHIQGLLSEVHLALAAGHLWLVAMGCRTLIDMFALERVGDIGGFEKKLSRLCDEGYLSRADVLVVKAAVEVGHEATHRAIRPPLDDCRRCLDIVENLLHRLVIAGSASAIQEARPKSQR